VLCFSLHQVKPVLFTFETFVENPDLVYMKLLAILQIMGISKYLFYQLSGTVE